MNDLLINLGFSVLLSSIKSEAARQNFKRAFQKVYVAIGTAYGWSIDTDPVDRRQLKLDDATKLSMPE